MWIQVSDYATNQESEIESVNISAFKGSNCRLSRVDACKDGGHSDVSSIKRVTSSSEDDCSVFFMKKGSLSAATKSRIWMRLSSMKVAVKALEMPVAGCAIPSLHPRKVAHSVVRVGPPRR